LTIAIFANCIVIVDLLAERNLYFAEKYIYWATILFLTIRQTNVSYIILYHIFVAMNSLLCYILTAHAFRHAMAIICMVSLFVTQIKQIKSII